jgi:predicted flap endonuclease-1-like 5' DNA nuclease
MIYLLQALSGWWIAAVVLGWLFGLFIAKPGQTAAWKIWSILVACLYVLGAVAASLKLLPDRYGFWLETALLLLTFYFVGYAAGAIARRLFGLSKAPAVAARPGRASGATAGQGAAPDAAPEGVVRGPKPEGVALDARQEGEALDVGQAAAFDAEQSVALDAGQGVAFDTAATEAPLSSHSHAAPVAEADDLLRIRGLDEGAAQDLREIGVRSFAQLAALTPEQERLFVDKRPDCGPATRQLWIAQAKLIDGGVDPDLSPPGKGAFARLDEGSALSLCAALPEIITGRVHDALYAGTRPLSLRLPPLGEMDDLKKIAGIDPATAERLNALGIWTYTQIACWSDQNIRWIGSYLAYPGRVERESWVGQAQALVD